MPRSGGAAAWGSRQGVLQGVLQAVLRMSPDGVRAQMRCACQRRLHEVGPGPMSRRASAMDEWRNAHHSTKGRHASKRAASQPTRAAPAHPARAGSSPSLAVRRADARDHPPRSTMKISVLDWNPSGAGGGRAGGGGGERFRGCCRGRWGRSCAGRWCELRETSPLAANRYSYLSFALSVGRACALSSSLVLCWADPAHALGARCCCLQSCC